MEEEVSEAEEEAVVEVLVAAVAEDFVEEADFKNLNQLNQKQLTFEKSYPIPYIHMHNLYSIELFIFKKSNFEK